MKDKGLGCLGSGHRPERGGRQTPSDASVPSPAKRGPSCLRRGTCVRWFHRRVLRVSLPARAPGAEGSQALHVTRDEGEVNAGAPGAPGDTGPSSGDQGGPLGVCTELSSGAHGCSADGGVGAPPAEGCRRASPGAGGGAGGEGWARPCFAVDRAQAGCPVAARSVSAPRVRFWVTRVARRSSSEQRRVRSLSEGFVPSPATQRCELGAVQTRVWLLRDIPGWKGGQCRRLCPVTPEGALLPSPETREDPQAPSPEL